MSLKVMALVWDEQRIKSQSQLLVLLALANDANDDHFSYPSEPRIAQFARLSVRQAQRVIHDLEGKGILYKKAGRGRGRYTRYIIAIGLNKQRFEKAMTYFDDLTEDDKTAWLERFIKGDIMASPFEDGKGDTIASPIKRRKGDKVTPIKTKPAKTKRSKKVTSEPIKGDILDMPQEGIHADADEENTPRENADPYDPNTNTNTNTKYIRNSLTLIPTAPPQKAEPEREPAIVALMETISSEPESPAIEDEEPHAEGEEVLPPPHPPGHYVLIDGVLTGPFPKVGTAQRFVKEHGGTGTLTQTPPRELVAHPPPEKSRKEKPPKPRIYSDADLFDAIGRFCFNATDAADLRAVGGRIGPIRERLADYICDKLARAPDEDEIASVVARVKELPDDYRQHNRDASPPATPDTFMTAYLKLLKRKGGNGNGTGARYVWRGKEWPVHEGRVHVEVKSGIYRNIPASPDNWQSFLDEMSRQEKQDAAFASK